MTRMRSRMVRGVWWTLAVALATAIGGGGARAQAPGPFVSGSDGADGDLVLKHAGIMIAGRYVHTATLLKDPRSVLITGGYNGSAYVNSAELYDLEAKQFFPLEPMAHVRYGHTATLLSDGRVLITGGYNGSNYANRETELFNPATRKFTRGPDMTVARSYYAAVVLNDPANRDEQRRVLFVGGYSSTNTETNTAEIYDESTNSFTPTPGSMAVPRQTHGAVRLPSGTVVVIGGYNGSARELDTAETYDPAAGQFSLLPARMTARRQEPGVALLPSGRVLVAGGYLGGGHSSAEVFDPATGLFTPTVRGMGEARSNPRLTVLPSGLVLITGGWSGSARQSAELYDPSAGVFAWTKEGMTVPRNSHVATLMPNGSVLLTGGYRDNGPVNSIVDVYDPATQLFGSLIFNRPAAKGGNVYHFRSIRIASGVTAVLRGPELGMKPIYWLSQGTVEIDGTISLSGEGGSGIQYPCLSRPVPVPGAGGFPGGVGGTKVGAATGPGNSPGEDGSGPGGGRRGDSSGPYRSGAGAGHSGGGGATNQPTDNGGKAYGNGFLTPLVGGSGGGGATVNPSWGFQDVCAAAGGSGGGALVIASSASIAVRGVIVADGGHGGCGPMPDGNNIGFGGGGSGGSIFLQAPVILGGGQVFARGGGCCGMHGRCGGGASGRIRLEATRQEFTGQISPAPQYSSPHRVGLPANVPTLRVARIEANGVTTTVPENPTGSFEVPDVSVDGSDFRLIVKAAHIPLGTPVTVYISSENGPDQRITSQVGLSGAVEDSEVAVDVTLPRGLSRGYPRAVWQ